MGSLMGSFFGSAANKSADETMAHTSLSGSAATAMAYLTAALEASTPEVRRLFSEYCTQSVLANEAITTLALKKGWLNPYDQPTIQLQSTIQDAQSVLNAQ